MYHTPTNWQQILQYIETQNKKIKQLEDMLTILQKEVTDLKERPSVNVEKIEYKFDQLKVETLEGTLNIGLNPNDLNNIEDLAVNQPNQNIDVLENGELRQQLIEGIQQYLNDGLPSLIGDTEAQLSRTLDGSYYKMIQEDLEKQLPQRVDFYLQTFPASAYEKGNPQGAYDKIFYKLKNDIHQAVFAFISQIPSGMNRKDEKHEPPSH
ncbi:spore germination protein GerPC [Bacillus sp. 2205SS5-2]|uniref:spore germination protein GerPC n=1 Tax=Bacillus sp. 2205SS5-2 TaxID=3109031 RepID=UPI0030048E1B